MKNAREYNRVLGEKSRRRKRLVLDVENNLWGLFKRLLADLVIVLDLDE